MSKSQSKKEETKKKADLWYSKFSTMMGFSGCLGSIALDIGDGKSVRIWMRHTGQLTKDDVLFHLKRLTDRIDATEQKARGIRNKYSDRFSDMAKKALVVLEVIRFRIEQVNSDIVFHGSNESVEWLRQRCLDAHERASEYCRELEVLSREFQTETIEPPGTSAEKARPESKKSFKDRFSFAPGQVFFDGTDLQLPTGDTLDIMKKLVSTFGFVVAHEKLKPDSVNSATDKLRGVIRKINERLKKHKVPCLVLAKRTEGYYLTTTNDSR